MSSELLLTEGDPPPFDLVNPQGRSGTVLICDHAANRIPTRLGDLGLGAEALQTHIAWDPGAAAVARTLSRLLDAPLVLSGYSRLAIDCNRPPESPDSIAERSAGIAVPGNRELTEPQRRLRIDELFTPYHCAIEALLDGRQGEPTRLLSIHSFTPILDGVTRHWVVGVASRRARAFAAGVIRALRERNVGVVGDNQPYAIDDAQDYSLPIHGERRGIDHAMVEIRQDGLIAPTDARRWAEHLAAAIRRVEATG